MYHIHSLAQKGCRPKTPKIIEHSILSMISVTAPLSKSDNLTKIFSCFYTSIKLVFLLPKLEEQQKQKNPLSQTLLLCQVQHYVYIRDNMFQKILHQFQKDEP